MNALFSPRAQLIFAWVLLVVSLIGWPVSMFTVASSEPPFILGLSWAAITIGAWNTIVTTQVNRDVTEDVVTTSVSEASVSEASVSETSDTEG